MRTKLEIIQRAQNKWIEFKKVQITDQREEKKIIRVEEQKEWQSTDLGCIKMNVSSVCDKSCNKVGISIIAKDAKKRCVQAWPVARDRTIDPVVDEVDAVHIALLMAQQNGWNKVKIQVDIKNLANCL